VLRDLEEIQDAEKARLASELGSNIRKANGFDRIDLDLSFFHGVAAADSDVGTGPDADAAGDFAATNAVAKTLGEDHGESVQKIENGRSPFVRSRN